MSTTPQDYADKIAATSTAGLLTAAYSLTHRIADCHHRDDASGGRDAPHHARMIAGLRAERDLIEAEILRRTGSTR